MFCVLHILSISSELDFGAGDIEVLEELVGRDGSVLPELHDEVVGHHAGNG